MVGVAQLVEPRIVDPVVVGSNPIVHPIMRLFSEQPLVPCTTGFGPLAQLVEQLTLNQLVVGSSPTRPTTFNIPSAFLPRLSTAPNPAASPFRRRKRRGFVYCIQVLYRSGHVLRKDFMACRGGSCSYCESGGTGRRAGFRFQWGNPWGFESPLSHHSRPRIQEKWLCPRLHGCVRLNGFA